MHFTLGTDLPPQRFTEACTKLLVPQTGNAVEGFCPSEVMGHCGKHINGARPHKIKKRYKNLVRISC